MPTRIAPLKKVPAYVLVFEALEDEILSGRIAEGEAIPTEMALCEQFDVQRSTIREGIRLLEQSGLVRRGPGKRLLVARPLANEAAESTSRGLERHGVSFADIWESVSIILPGTANLAAQNMSRGNVSALESITAKLLYAEDVEDVVTHAVEYLDAVSALTGNKVIAVVLPSLNLLVQSSLRRVINSLPQARERIANAQREMTAALKARDGNLAAEWMSRHLDDLKRGYEVAGVDLETEVGSFDRAG